MFCRGGKRKPLALWAFGKCVKSFTGRFKGPDTLPYHFVEATSVTAPSLQSALC